MARASVVTGSASGIGKATKEVLESHGEKVIGVDFMTRTSPRISPRPMAAPRLSIG